MRGRGKQEQKCTCFVCVQNQSFPKVFLCIFLLPTLNYNLRTDSYAETETLPPIFLKTAQTKAGAKSDKTDVEGCEGLLLIYFYCYFTWNYLLLSESVFQSFVGFVLRKVCHNISFRNNLHLNSYVSETIAFHEDCM